MSRLFVSLLLGITFLSLPSFSTAGESGQLPKLVREYINAVKADDPQAIDQATAELTRNPEFVDYMRKNLPRTYHSYQLRTVVLRLKDLRRDIGGASLPPESTASQQGGPAPSNPSNRDATQDFSNQDRRTNQEITASNPNQKRISNSEIGRTSDNRDRISNQDRIRNRPPNRVQ